MIISKPNSTEYPDFMQKYIDNLPNDINLTKHLIQNLKEIIALFVSVPNDKYSYKYEDNKWTIKEVLLHIIDTERVFAYRALVYARGDKTILPSFNENNYTAKSNAHNRTTTDLLDELKTVRLATISLFKTFTHDQFAIVGKTADNNLSVTAIAFVTIGHSMHHIQIIKERYLTK